MLENIYETFDDEEQPCPECKNIYRNGIKVTTGIDSLVGFRLDQINNIRAET